MTVTGLVKTSLIDYPGKIACVLFVPGCNYNCFYCHNRQLIEGSDGILEPERITEFLNERRGFLDGVVISGGEPTIQPELIPFMENLREMGYRVKLDTNGSSPEVVKEVLERSLCDYCAVDYKAPRLRYPEICGAGAEADKTLETIRLLLESGADFEVRTTVIPQLGEEDLITMAKELPVLPRYSLNLYRKPLKFLPEDRERVGKTPYSQAQLNILAGVLREYQPNVRS